jgi:hypothetical protein
VLEGGLIVAGGGRCKTGTSAVLALTGFTFASLLRPRNERRMETKDEPLPLLARSFVNGRTGSSVCEVDH